MKTGITYRLFLAILLAAGLAVVSMVLIMQWSLSRGFLRYINTVEKSSVSLLAAKLEEGYGRELSWDFVRRDPARWRQVVIASLPEEAPPPPEDASHTSPPLPPAGEGGPPPRPLPPHLAHNFAQRLFLLDAGRKVLVGQVAVPADSEATPLRHGGRTVGFLGLLPRTNLSEGHQQRFLKEQRLALTLVAGIVVALSAGLSLILATRLVRPLRELARATHQLAAGTYSVRVPVSSSDEVGQLAADFNSLALTLEKNEKARRNWVADISHELRTPVAILQGEIEALQDGIRQPTPDAVHSLHVEVLRLGRLVDDLYQLSLSDVGALTYRKTDLDLAGLLTESLATFRPAFEAKGISLSRELAPEGPAIVFGDEERLRQLFANLLSNALNYTDHGGEAAVGLTCRNGSVTIDFQDSAPGVPDGDIPRLFERLYRVEESRSRAAGGAGLGLAICRNIVEAHAGTIEAQHSPMGGLWIRSTLPLTEGHQ